MTYFIAPLVEGQTEEASIGLLLHRIWNEILVPPSRLQVIPSARAKRDRIVRPDLPDLVAAMGERYSELSRMLRKEPMSAGLVLILLDADRDCPATLGPELLALAKSALPPEADVACVFVKRAYENWLVGGAGTLAGVRGMPDVIPPRVDCENRNGATWIRDRLREVAPNAVYDKIQAAPEFIRRFDLAEARENCPSFDKLCRDLAARLPADPEPEPPPV